MNATKLKTLSHGLKEHHQRYGRWLERKTPSIDEWGDIYMWIDGEPIDSDDVSSDQADSEAWRVVADDYEESLYGYDIDWSSWPPPSSISQVYEENQCYEDRSVYVDSWTRRDDVEWCWRVHEEQTEREISDYYEREDQMTDTEINAGWSELHRETAAWNPDHYLFGMHLPKR